MKRLLLILLLLSPLPGLAQTVIDTLHWSATRRLKLSDFHAPIQPGLGGSEFHYQLGYEVRPTAVLSLPAIESFCLMFRNLSWVSETARNERTLAYNQVLFDLVEVHSRQMKAQLIALNVDKQFKPKAKQIEYLTNSELGAEVNRFRSETGGGDDLQALERWQQQIAKQLYDTPDLVTTYRPARFGYGIFLGVGGALPVGELNQTINKPGGFVLGLDIAYRRTMLLLHATLYNCAVQSEFSHNNQTWQSGMPVNPTLYEIGFGHIIRTTARTRFIPYVGYRLLELSPHDRNDERFKGFSLIDHAPTAGLIVDFTFNCHADRPEDNFWFVRTKLAYSPVLTPAPFSGGLINFQLGVGGFGRPRKVIYQPTRTVVYQPEKRL